ncbi:hypothetical protein GQ600_25243 [Phytophthora cactorum]|nr:hypothetical protein GQ600_25243 [Phytophthora cactorum]
MPIDRAICANFYKTLGQGQYRCKRCGSERKLLVGTGYSNLIAHLAHKHEGFKDQFAATLSSNAQSLQNFGFVSQETSDRFQWLRWVVERNMPLSEIDNELTRSMSSWGAVSSRVLLNSMHHIVKKERVNLEVILGIGFGIMFDGWSNGFTDYVAVYSKCRRIQYTQSRSGW